MFNEIISAVSLVDANSLKLADIDVEFIATNVGGHKGKLKHMNPERHLCRYEFVEIIVRLALTKYKKNKLLAYAGLNPPDSLRRIFDDHLGTFIQGFEF